MSAGVDVLRVLDELIAAQRQAWGVPETGIVEARAAVAALIAERDALREACEYARAEMEDKEHVAHVRREFGLAEYYKKVKTKLAAALAKVQP